MIKKKKNEKRKYPRITKRLPLKVVTNGYDFTTATKNVSCVGAYCHINRYVPPFTRVNVKLTMPVLISGGKKNYHVQCNGVIVRTEDEAKGGFNIAIFFNRINATQRNKISRYISQFFPKESCLRLPKQR